jgi:hypothetical protein
MGYYREDTMFFSLNLTAEQYELFGQLVLRGPVNATVEDLLATAAGALLSQWNAKG